MAPKSKATTCTSKKAGSAAASSSTFAANQPPTQPDLSELGNFYKTQTATGHSFTASQDEQICLAGMSRDPTAGDFRELAKQLGAGVTAAQVESRCAELLNMAVAQRASIEFGEEEPLPDKEAEGEEAGEVGGDGAE